MKSRLWFLGLLGGLALAVACGDDSNATPDAGTEITTSHCDYEAVPPTANTGGTVVAGPLRAGVAEMRPDIPVSTALGAYTARAGFLGTAGTVDLRKSKISGSFNPSIGIETAPVLKVLALEAGGETIIIVRLDVALGYEGMLFDVEKRLGPEFSGKVLLSHSHTHSGFAQFTGSSVLKVGLGEFRELVYTRWLDAIETTARTAISNLQAAKIGIITITGWDPDNIITRDRRGENDELMGGSRKDDTFFMIRIDQLDDTPMVMIPIYGVHGTLMPEENSFASVDAPGAMGRLLQERFDFPVTVMHLQGAGADVSPKPRGGLNCDIVGAGEDDPCFEWLKLEAHARGGADLIYQSWVDAGAVMKTDIELEMLTKSIENGPYADTFTIRDGALEYAPFDNEREADGEIWAGSELISPIDEFNAPVGAALCEEDYPIFPAGLMPGTDFLPPYGSCVRIDTAGEILGALLKFDFESDSTKPVCQSTRTTVSALRIGDYVIGTAPGELSVLLADIIRESSPVAPDKTILLGYAQGHVGYMMSPEDWVTGGYESSINVWGPLEAEYIGERLLEVMQLAWTPEREDGAATGIDRNSTPIVVDDLPTDVSAPMAGTIPSPVPERVWARIGQLTDAQPAAQIARVSGHATFVWIGDDPKVKTPVVTLERETSPGSGVYQSVRRRSGRLLLDGELLLMYTPLPVRRVDDEPQTHYWVAEWQAVPWAGADDGLVNLDGMDARAGVPLGNYRFHVVGSSFELTSNSFVVTNVGLIVGASAAGTDVSALVRLQDSRSYRLLDMELNSNEAVPVRNGTFSVELTLSAGGPLLFTNVVADSDGNVTVDAAGDAANVISITVTDSFGNSGTGTL